MTAPTSQIWSVAVNAPLPIRLSYEVGDFPVSRGDTVIVPLGTRQAKGLVLGPGEASTKFELKKMLQLVSDYPKFHEPFLRWLEWLADYYIFHPGQVVEMAYPPLSRKTQRASRKSNAVPTLARDTPPKLNSEQMMAVEKISSDTVFKPHLLYGITGSGKTEVYLHLLEKVLLNKKRGLVLVPEISLTPQLLQRFVRRFGDEVAVIHSHLTDREKTNQWWDIVEGRKRILIGARSALFCPIHDLGIIIVDEEHEPSFKQDEKLKYNARDSAIVLAQLQNCPIVLGSATPSLESWKNTLDGRYELHRLSMRHGASELPPIEVVPLKEQKKEILERPAWLSPRLLERMNFHLDQKNQVALFLNRRGLSPMVFCTACGHTRQCPNCDINLTLHFHQHLICHYCDYHENRPDKCPDCHEGLMEPMGLGTERIEEDLKRIFPDARVRRADRDEIQGREDLESLIKDMEEEKIDILIGTQMIAKGLDFPKLKLVGLVLADIGFNIPDFRANERSFQLMTQMSGRSGRHQVDGDAPGEVLIQAFNTSHESLLYAQQHDFEGFAVQELEHRRQLHYPPFSKIASLRIQSPKQALAHQTSLRLAERAQVLKNKFEPYLGLEILGPAEAPLAKLRNQFRFHVLLKSDKPQILNRFVRQLLGDEDWVPSSVRILVDIDPLHLL
jgi:primosomal protein N' (replication factor Y)